MELISVYRIENPDTGIGPFQTRNEFCQKLALKAAKIHYLWPAPMDDALLNFGMLARHYVYGAPSMDALKRWFLLGDHYEENARILTELETLGFRLMEYLVDSCDVRVGMNKLHVAFDPRQARSENFVEAFSPKLMLETEQCVFCTGVYDVSIFN